MDAPTAGPTLIFDKYEIIRRLAVGGMGEIFLARQRGVAGFDRLVILKNLLPDLAEQPGFIDQFLDEARVAATLNHPNIVSIYEVGAWQGVYFIAMEYINGEAVSQLMGMCAKQGLGLPYPLAVRIAHDAALGLDHAHHASDPTGQPLNIVHRDVTPQNIMVRTDGVTKVVDFGVARAANRATRTATGLVKGKVPYMPPEQLSGGDLDGRADQWALGVVLWEMLCGKRLFKAENDAMVITRILREPIPPPEAMGASVPPELSAIVMRMLRRDRNNRFARLHDVADALQSCLDSVSQQSSESAVAAFVQKVAGEKIRERVADLTPSKPENFVLQLKKPKEDAPGTVVGSGHRPAASKAPLYAGVGVAVVAMGVLLGVLQPWRSPPPPPPPAVETPSPPKPEVPVEPPKPVPTPAPEPAPTVLEIKSDPSEASVYLDSRLAGVTPLRLSTLQPDVEYQLVMEKAGFETALIRVKLEKGATKELSQTLRKKKERKGTPVATPSGTGPSTPTAAPAATADGFLTLKTTPWTNVSVNGTPLGPTPLYKTKLAPGKYTLELVNESAGVNEKRAVEIKPGEVTKLDFALGK